MSKLTKLSDSELQSEIEALRQERTQFENQNRWTREDAHRGADRWVESARSFIAWTTGVEPFASNGRDVHSDAILQMVAGYILETSAFTDWLHATIESRPALGGSNFSAYTRDVRDAELQRFDEQIRERETELARRDLDAAQQDLDERKKLLA
jgi:hypothetical protein